MSLNSLPFDDAASNGDPAPANPSGGNHKPRKTPPANPKRATDAEWEARAEIEAARLDSVADSAAIPKPEPPPVVYDPFDPSNLAKMKLSQDFAAMAAVKPVITSVAVRKPNKHEFVRVRPGSVWRFDTGCFVDKDTREVYMVTPELWPMMPGDVTPTALVVALSRNSPIPFLWPLVLPSSDGRPNRWHESGIEAARLAESQWLRSVADMSAGCYVPFVAAAKLPEPEWPTDLTMSDLLRLAFQGRFIRDNSHPCLQRLRGEI